MFCARCSACRRKRAPRQRLRGDRAAGHRRAVRDRRNTASPAPTRRRRSRNCASPVRRSASSTSRSARKVAAAVAVHALAVARASVEAPWRGVVRRGCLPSPDPSRRIGEGRAGRSSRCALPTTAFFETPSRLPISAVECPSSHSARKRMIVSSAHSISWFPQRVTTKYGKRLRAAVNSSIARNHKNLWTTVFQTTIGWERRAMARSFATRTAAATLSSTLHPAGKIAQTQRYP
jgi:hypothetical protein